MGTTLMTDDQFRQDFNAAINSLREEVRTGMRSLVDRLSRLERTDETGLQTKITDAFNEGLVQGRVEALEKRMDKSDRWLLALGSGVLVAAAVWAVELVGRLSTTGAPHG